MTEHRDNASAEATAAWNQRCVVLASGSPRRRALLEGLGFAPVVRPAEVDEQRRPGEAPVVYTRRLSEEKGQAVAGRPEALGPASPWIVAADTVVVFDGEVLEKPVDGADARAMLSRLSGRWHTVVSSFAVVSAIDPQHMATRTVTAEVHFRRLSAEEIGRYVATGEPMDKAGSYGIQNVGSFLVREVRGSYFAVVGLPVCELVETLLEVGAVTTFPFLGEGAVAIEGGS